MSFLQRFQSSLESLYTLPADAYYVVAYSGGVDSHVLLHCCYKLKIPVRAVHIHHGLQGEADNWVLHCEKICGDLNIQLEVIYVDATKRLRQSPEESARIVRYAALQESLKGGDCLLTAQHLNDQAETFLLQLFRSASSAGLAAMPSSKRIGNHFHLRPLLFFSRHDIETYADEHSLSWIEDPSNLDERFERNFVRRKLLPLLKERWPESVEQLVTVAELQSSNLQVLEDMAAIDLASVVVTPGVNFGQRFIKTWAYDVVSVLSIARLKSLSTARLLNVLRYWAKQTIADPETAQLPDDFELSATSIGQASPTRKLLLEINKTMLHSAQDATPVIVFSGYEYRKFQNNLYLLKAKRGTGKSKLGGLEWKPSQDLYLPAFNRYIRSVESSNAGLKKYLLDEKLTISFRKGGEQLHPVERNRSQSLKKLFQEANIFPWEREAIPLLFWQDELIAVVGLWIDRRFAADESENGWLVEVVDG